MLRSKSTGSQALRGSTGKNAELFAAVLGGKVKVLEGAGLLPSVPWCAVRGVRKQSLMFAPQIVS